MVYDFRLGNKKLSDFGGVILFQEEGIDSVQMLNTAEDVYIDGQCFFNSRYSQREFSFYVHFENGLSAKKVRELTAWIMCKDEQELEFFGDERYEGLVINVIYSGVLNIANYAVFNVGNSINLKFTAYNPYWTLKSEDKMVIESPKLIVKYKFSDNESNSETYPRLTLRPLTQDVKFRWHVEGSYLEVTLKGLDTSKEYIIDSESGEFYYIENGKKINSFSNFNIDSDFLMLYKKAYEDCEFELFSGSVSYVHIYPKSRVI